MFVPQKGTNLTGFAPFTSLNRFVFVKDRLAVGIVEQASKKGSIWMHLVLETCEFAGVKGQEVQGIFRHYHSLSMFCTVLPCMYRYFVMYTC